MAYNEELDIKIADAVEQWRTTRKKMFGGTCYLINGNMMCGVYKDFLILRLDPVEAERALSDVHVRQFDITGRPMKGWIMVDAAACGGQSLNNWLKKARNFAEKLQPK